MTERIWLGSYPAGVPADIDVGLYGSLVDLMEDSFQKYDRACCECGEVLYAVDDAD